MGGKKEEPEASGINVDQSHPGCMWGVLHVLKYHGWKYVRKRMPRKRMKNENPGKDSHPSDASKSVEQHNDAGKECVVGEQPSKSGGSKRSIKSRIKALMTEDKHRKKGKKHHHIESVPNSDRQVESIDAAQQEQKLKNEEELKTDAGSKEPQNLTNLNNESLMKLFPASDPSRREEFGMMKLKSMQESVPRGSDFRKDEILNRSRSLMTGNADSFDKSSVHVLKNSGESQPVSCASRFKKLKRKIKQVLDESRNEKQRITRDAVLHKVTPGSKFAKEMNKDTPKQLKHPLQSGASSPQHINRTSSVIESVDRYCKLYEVTNQESESVRPQSRANETSPPKTPQKQLQRFRSLPDLHYFSYQNEDSSEDFFASIKNALDGSYSAKAPDNSVKAAEVNSLARDHIGRRSASIAITDGIAEMGLHIDDSGGLVAEDCPSQHEHDVLPRRKPSFKLEDLSSVSRPKSGFEEDTPISIEEVICSSPKEMQQFPNQHLISERSNDIGKVEIQVEKVDEIPRLRVEESNRAEFHYVRDVLELSGFSGTEALGRWHADDQALDPCMYEEVDGYLVLEPDCSGNEGPNCDQLVLFDVTSEVLVEIYNRSCSYVPRRLSSVSHIHPLPSGQHVLAEVWEEVRWYLSFKAKPDQPADDVMAKDLAKNDGWMNLQSESECLGIELESLIFDEILEEAIWE